jgi:hypothetical protein
MHTINFQPVDGHVRVTVSRWPQNSRYPVVLVSFELIDCRTESELGMVSRVAQAVSREAESARQELQDETLW